MPYNELTINYKDITKLIEKWKQLPKSAEYETNKFLWNDGGDIFRKQVMQNMPRSSKNKSVYRNAPTVHAKDVESLDKVTYNLGIKIQTKLSPRSKDFGYLIFPDEGRGKHEPRAQEFFGHALTQKEDEVADKLLEHLNEKIEEDLK
jgi:uncharacterized protein (DUF924 family)